MFVYALPRHKFNTNMQKKLVDQAPATCSQYTLDAGHTRRIHLDLPAKTTNKTLDIAQGGTTVSSDPLGRVRHLLFVL